MHTTTGDHQPVLSLLCCITSAPFRMLGSPNCSTSSAARRSICTWTRHLGSELQKELLGRTGSDNTSLETHMFLRPSICMCGACSLSYPDTVAGERCNALLKNKEQEGARTITTPESASIFKSLTAASTGHAVLKRIPVRVQLLHSLSAADTRKHKTGLPV